MSDTPTATPRCIFHDRYPRYGACVGKLSKEVVMLWEPKGKVSHSNSLVCYGHKRLYYELAFQGIEEGKALRGYPEQQ